MRESTHPTNHVRDHCLATARQPCSNMPCGGCMPVCRYTSGCVRGIMMSPGIFSMHSSTRPRSVRQTASGACSFTLPTWLRSMLPSLPCVEHSLRLLDGAVIIEGTSSVFSEEGGTGSGCRGSSEGVEVSTRGRVEVALVDGAIAAAFRFTFHLF